MGFTLTPDSMNFAEDFVPAPATIVETRQSAVFLGADLLSDGSLATMTLMARVVQAKAVVEIGTGTGATGLAFFAGMTDDGVLTSIDPEADRQHEARRAFTNAGIAARRFRLINGIPLEVLPKLQDGSYDVVLINGDKLEYVEYFDQALRLLRHGGVIIMNHALWKGLVADVDNEDDETVIIREALEAVSATEELTTALIPLGDGLLISIKG